MIPQALVLIASVLVSSTVIGCKSEQGSAGQTSAASTAAAQGAAADPGQFKNGFDGMPPVGTKAKCPVMGTEFQVTKETQSSVYKGKTYVFCCNGCKPQFDANPDKYVGSS
jgi:YHS domain-containing protein